MEDYIKRTLERAKELHLKSKQNEGAEETELWQRNAQFALNSALNLSLINLKVNPIGFIVNFNDDITDGNEVFVNGTTLNTSIEGLYNMPIERLQRIAGGENDMIMDNNNELKK